MQWYSDNRHGSASWATRDELARAGLYARKGVFLGLCPFLGHPLTLDSDAPLTLIGGAGSGKGATKLLYNNFYHGSMLINDPKGEIGAMTWKYQQCMGKEVWCINPSGLHTSAPWNMPRHKLNPVGILKPSSPHLVSDCMRIAAMLNPADAHNPFFTNRPRQWFSNLLHAYVLAFGKPTLPDFAAMLGSIQSDFESFKSLAKTFSSFAVPDINRTCAEIIDRKKTAPEEYSGVMSTIATNMQFMADPQLQNLFSAADFSLDVLTRANPPAVVDIAFPAENLGIWSKALRLIIGVAILYQQRSAGGAKPLFLIDEAAQLGHFEELERSYTYGRSFYRTYAVFQDIGQITRHYGREGVQTFLGSSQAKTFIGVRDYETAQLVSNMLGNQTIEVENPIYAARARHARQQAVNSLIFGAADPFRAGMDIAHWTRQERHRDKAQRPLLTPDEVLTLPENRSLVFLSGLDVRPIMAGRMPYFQNPAIPAGAFLPNPYHV